MSCAFKKLSGPNTHSRAAVKRERDLRGKRNGERRGKRKGKQGCCGVAECRVPWACTRAVDTVEARKRGRGLEEVALALGAREQRVERLRDLSLERLRRLGRHAAAARPEQERPRGRELHAEAHAAELGRGERVGAQARGVEQVLRDGAAARVPRARQHVRRRLERRQRALAGVGGGRVLRLCPEAKAGHRSSPQKKKNLVDLFLFCFLCHICEKSTLRLCLFGFVPRLSEMQEGAGGNSKGLNGGAGRWGSGVERGEVRKREREGKGEGSFEGVTMKAL